MVEKTATAMKIEPYSVLLELINPRVLQIDKGRDKKKGNTTELAETSPVFRQRCGGIITCQGRKRVFVIGQTIL